MSFDNAYESLIDGHEDAHWAFGTGFSEPLSGVDREVPDVDRADLAAYCLMLGDDALVMSQRLAEWCSRAPELEEDVALANIALDLLGQARMLLTRAGEVEGAGRDEGRPGRDTGQDGAARPRTGFAGPGERDIRTARGGIGWRPFEPLGAFN